MNYLRDPAGFGVGDRRTGQQIGQFVKHDARNAGTVIAYGLSMSLSPRPRCVGRLVRRRHGGVCSATKPQPDRSRGRTRCGARRSFKESPAQVGFTLVELMAVVVIVGIMATLAIPAVTKQLRDSRTRHVAEQIADQYRTARMRALGRGGAVMIRIEASSTTGPGTIEVREAVRGSTSTDPDSDPTSDAAAYMPVSSCTLTDWNLPDLATGGGFTASRRIFYYRAPSEVSGDKTEIDIWLPGETEDAEVSSLSVCFTPMGRAFRSTDLGDTWSPLTSVPYAEVQRTSHSGSALGMPRRVMLLPNGNARLTGMERRSSAPETP